MISKSESMVSLLKYIWTYLCLLHKKHCSFLELLLCFSSMFHFFEKSLIISPLKLLLNTSSEWPMFLMKIKLSWNTSMNDGSIYLFFMWIVLDCSSCWINWEFIILAWSVSFEFVLTSWVMYISFSLFSRISLFVSNFYSFLLTQIPNFYLISSI